MQLSRRITLLLGLAALAAVGLVPASATTLDGNYNNHSNPPSNYDGYNATASGNPYTITPTASFDNNGQDGFSSLGFGATITVNGGTFDSNGRDGLIVAGQDAGGYVLSASTVIVNEGSFNNNHGAGFSLGTARP